ncbi:MAG TPA: hypothetical protein P5538_01180 [Bacteroidales bacterium]|nr:hypothetical protein [Bacteroidales bacterium]HOL97840.1 hypothetical protein [Bacteroidales bacterium]HOM35889.1 hypothetical protein [Bacteroidales bacterium]HPD23191.1 hypothetical protein [Bacteroidales bacterium]HRS99196.1 hypothetical protein [Bacteroidales bacterium]
MKKLIFVTIIFVSTIYSSCTTTRIASLSKQSDESIELYTTKIPDKNYEEIYYIQTDGAIFHTPQHLLNGLKKKASELNADAVINIKYDFQGLYLIVSGTAIKYK